MHNKSSSGIFFADVLFQSSMSVDWFSEDNEIFFFLSLFLWCEELRRCTHEHRAGLLWHAVDELGVLDDSVQQLLLGDGGAAHKAAWLILTVQRQGQSSPAQRQQQGTHTPLKCCRNTHTQTHTIEDTTYEDLNTDKHAEPDVHLVKANYGSYYWSISITVVSRVACKAKATWNWGWARI